MKKRVDLLFLVLLTGNVLAQIGLQPYQAIVVNSKAQVVEIADINNDGLEDVIVGNSYSSNPPEDYKLLVFLQNAQGLLNPPIKYQYGNVRINAITVADVNNDQLLDVIIGAGEYVGVFYQNNIGQLLPIQNFYSGNSIDGVKCGDFNHDGKMDIAVSHWTENYISVFTQNNQGFTKNTYTKPSSGYDEIDVGDLNGDGLNDIVFMAGQSNSGIHVYIQKQNGTLNNYVSYFPAQTSWNTLNGIAIGDLNNDGKDDVVATMGGNMPNANIVIWFQDTTSGLLSSSPLVIPAYDIPESIEIADLDCNGTNEIILVNGGWNNLSIYQQNASGIYTTYNKFNIPYASHYNPYGLSIGDINNDGGKDIAIADYNNGLILLYNSSTADPAKNDTIAHSKSYDTTYSYCYTIRNAFTSNTYRDVNNYRITRTDSFTTTTIHREDSIRIDTAYIIASEFCNKMQFDTVNSSQYRFNTKVVYTDTVLISTVTDTVNLITEIKIYPNPTTGLIKIDLPSPFDSKNLVISMTNELGQYFFTKTFTDKRNKRQFDIGGHASGMYFLKFQIGDHKQIEKIVLIQGD